MATTKKKKASAPAESYNPFFTTLNGITALFTTGLSAGIIILLIDAVTSMSNVRIDSNTDQNQTINTIRDFFGQPITDQLPVYGIALIILIFAVVVGSMIHGIQSYTALRLAKDEKPTIGEAFNATLSNFGNYTLMYLLVNIKTFLWALLLIVPGIIAYYRYSFAGLVFFDKDLRLNAAIKESNRLTKGGLMTLFSSQTLFNMITLNYISLVVWVASVSQLYRIYTNLDTAGKDKPSVHWLSWVTLAIPFVLILFAAMFFVGLFVFVGLTGGRFSE